MRTQAPREFTIVDMARAFCIAAHAGVGQKRKYTGEDYHHHPEEALQILMTYCEPCHAQQAAILLHDVVEDTAVTRAHIAQVFGQTVARLVWGVTDVSRKEDGNRAARKQLDRDHVMSGCDKVLEMKLADLISNTRSIAKHDKKFGRVYLDEKIQILADMKVRMGGTPIYTEACEVAAAAGKEVFGTIAEHFDVWDKHFQGRTDYKAFLKEVYPEITDVEVQSYDSLASKQNQPNV